MTKAALAFIPVGLFFSSLCAAADLKTVCDAGSKYHTETITGGKHNYAVRMGGTIDGEVTRDPVGYWAFDQYWEPNLYVRIENIGNEPVVNPWLLRAGKPDTRTARSIAEHLFSPSMSDAEKARRLWEFEIKSRFHATTSDEEVDDVVKRFNVYGYTLCGNESKIMSDLWRAGGLKVRKGFPNGHSTAEVFYDGAWHLLDSDESIICLLRDNKTIASEEQIVADHDLMKRTHTYGPLHDDNPMRDETSSALHYYEGERKGEQPSLTRHKMDFTLRPSESITWAWNPGNRFHGAEFEGKDAQLWNKRWRLLPHVMNGEMTYAPDLAAPGTLKYIDLAGAEFRKTGPFGTGLYVVGRSGSVTVPVKSAYPVVGGRLEVDFSRRDVKDEDVKVLISFDEGRSWREIRNTFGSDYARIYIDLDEFFPTLEPARYGYLVRVELISRAEQPLVCLRGFRLSSKLQMARLALPGLSLGENSFTYTDQSGPGGKVRITHAWSECQAAEIPGPPLKAAYPPDGGTAAGTRITFRWDPPAGTEAADYEFQLGEFADMRWVLSPNFHKLISRTADRGTSSYALPYTGLLNPGETYYWRVRARSREGVWGPWSKTFSFSASAPAVPVSPQAQFDKASRTATLRWQRGVSGTEAVRYRVYGSAERGFTPHESAYEYNAGVDGMKRVPGNLLLETKSAATSVNLPSNLWRAYYRVVAIDSEGRESGASDLAELTHPVILTRALAEGKPGTFYETNIDVNASIGHLVSADVNGKPYHMKFRGGDDLVFSISGAPKGLTIDPKSGLIAGYLPREAAGMHVMTISVLDQRTGTADSLKLPLRVAEPADQRKKRR